jgi:hypothetical protein
MTRLHRLMPAALCAACLLGGCAAIPEKDKALVAAEPDCNAPEAQITRLKKLKPTGFKRTMTTVGYVSPAGLIGGAVNSDFDDRNRIINGEYGAEIDRKIAEIRAACKVPAPG